MIMNIGFYNLIKYRAYFQPNNVNNKTHRNLNSVTIDSTIPIDNDDKESIDANTSSNDNYYGHGNNENYSN